MLPILFLISSLLGANPAHAANAQPEAQLQEIVGLLETIENEGLHSQDMGRMMILKQVTNATAESLNAVGLGHMKTIHLYQELIVKFRFSAQFFQFIVTSNTQKNIAQLLTDIEQIRKERGFDDEPYSKFLKSNLGQMVVAIRALLKDTELDPKTRTALQGLMPLLANAIPQADLGDRPNAFAQAIDVFHKVQNLYPLLSSLHASQPRHQLALEIMGLNELIGEYSQAH